MPERNENSQMRDAFVRRQIELLQQAEVFNSAAQELLDSSEPRLRVLVEQFLSILTDRRVDLTSPVVQNRLNTLRRRIEELRIRTMQSIEEELEEEFRLLVAAQWAWLGTTVSTITDGRLVPTAPGGRQLARETVRDIPFEGRTFREWLRNLAIMDSQRIYGAILVGLSQGLSKRAILKSVLGTTRMDGKDGVTQKTRNYIGDILTTAVVHFGAFSVDLMGNANPDIFPRDIFTAVLDNATTPICRPLDGRVYRRGEGPIPPLHFRCRSIRVPLLPGQRPEDITREERLAYRNALMGRP